MLDSQLLEKLSEYYKLPLPVTFVKEIEDGTLSHNYVISSEETDYFLKQHRSTDPSRIVAIHKVETLFSQNGIPVIQPITTLQGGMIIDFKEHFYGLYPFIRARKYNRKELPLDALLSMAENLAHMHQIGHGQMSELASPDPPENVSQKREKMIKILGIIDKLDTLSEYDQLAKASITMKLQLSEKVLASPHTPDLPNDHLTHGDYTEANVFFDDQDQVSHIFDFEKTMYAPRADEIIRSMDIVCLNVGYDRHNLGRASQYLQAYNHIYPISPKEIASAYKTRCYSAISSAWIEGEHYLNKHNRPDIFLPAQYNAIKYMSEHLDQLIDYFSDSLR